MSGHSKWHNIQRRKGKQDSARGQLFTRLSRDIYAAAREGGGNPDTNFRLKVALERGRQNNLSADSIARTLAKATGSLPGVSFEELLYEGYGPFGVAILLEIVTDNRNRTAADVRHIFSKRGGHLGESGCVAWMFERSGLLYIDKEGTTSSYDDVLLAVLEAGASDLEETETQWIVQTEANLFAVVRDQLENSGFTLADTELTYLPKTTVSLDEEQIETVLDLVEALEANDDVQSIAVNLEDL